MEALRSETDKQCAPMVSVIVPVYKVEAYLPACIDSILAQTFKDFELLLVDDGSPDRCGEICDEYARRDGRVRVFHQSNAGVSAARNVGLEHARGEWVAFVDSDDWVESFYLQTIMEQVGDADILFFSEVWHMADGCLTVLSSGACDKVGREAMEQEIEHMIDNGEGHNFFGFTWNKAFRASIIREYEVRFVKGLKISEDEVFTLAFCLHANKLRTIYAPLYHYRCYAPGLTLGSKIPAEFLELVDCFKALVPDLRLDSLRILYHRRIASLLLRGWQVERNPLKAIGLLGRTCSHCLRTKVRFPAKFFFKLCVRRVRGWKRHLCK